MPIDSQTLITEGSCYVCAGTSADQAIELALLARIVSGGIAPPVATKYLVTSNDYAPDASEVITITAQLATAGGVPVATAGLTVTWSKVGTGGSFSSPTSVTNASGIATVNFTAAVGNYTITATDNNGLTGTSATIVTALSALNSDWLTRILAAGGTRPSDNTFMANDVWYAALGTAGIQSKIKAANTYAPDNLIASFTPLIKGVGTGNDSWTNIGTITGASLTVNGLALNGTTQYLATGLNCVTMGLTSLTNHGCVYVSADDRSTAQTEYGTGTDATTSFRQYYHYSDNNTYFSNVGNVINAGAILGAANNPGYLCQSRTTGTRLDAYFANSGTPHSSIYNNLSNVTANLVGSNLLFAHASNENGTPTGFSKKRISFMCFGTALTSTESLALYNAVQALRTSYGGGAV